MRIVYIFKSLAQKAGTERILIDKMNYLCKEHQVYIITYEQGTHPISFLMDNRIKHIDLNVRFFTRYKYCKIKRFLSFFTMKKNFYRKLNSICRKISPDFVVCTTYAASLIDVIHNVSERNHAKLVIEAHTITDEIKGGNHSNSFKAIYAKLIYWYVMRQISKCDALVTLTEDDAKTWKILKKHYVISNSITYPSIVKEVKSKTVITAGRLEYQKGYDLLVDAWKYVHQRHPDWLLKIYGDGSMKVMLINKIKELGLQSAISILLPIDNIYDEYMNSAIYVSTSRFEGFGLSMAEAMACGTPCVAFDCPYGPKNIIRNEEDGILVKNLDNRELARQINYLIEHEEIRKQMGKKARNNIKRYAPEEIMVKWDTLFKEIK